MSFWSQGEGTIVKGSCDNRVVLQEGLVEMLELLGTGRTIIGRLGVKRCSFKEAYW